MPLKIARAAAMLLAFLLNPGITNAQEQPQTVERPSLKIGLTLQYDGGNGLYTVKLIELPAQDSDCRLPPCSKWSRTDKKETVYLYRDADLNLYKRTDLTGKPQYQLSAAFLKFPLTIGSSWKNEYVNSSSTPIDEKVTVEGWTRIHVLGADYQAVHVHMEDKRGYNRAYPRSDGSTFSQDYYYVPELGAVAKVDFTGDTLRNPDEHTVLTAIQK